jgi:hypothetical protein
MNAGPISPAEETGDDPAEAKRVGAELLSARVERRRGQRLIIADEVGALAAFLVSDDSSAMWTPAIA